MPVNDDDLSSVLESLNPEPVPTAQTLAPARSVAFEDDGDSPEDFMSGSGLQSARAAPDITRPWMKHHKFVLVRTSDELDSIVDACIASGRCALDLETEGLDNRIYYREDGSPYTKHQIVGFCISYDGVTGYYAPVRHWADDAPSHLNLPIARAEASIKRLCQASQPVPKNEEARTQDPLAFKDFEKPRLIIYFWNAKFDQEFLYPITGIDWWHPESFEDGNLHYYVFRSEDRKLGLKWKAFEELKDSEGNPYEMIELKDLFTNGREIRFALLSPDEPGCVKYACSDGICTFLLNEPPREHENRRDNLAIVREKYSFTNRLEKQCSQAIRWMERPRVRVNKEKVRVQLEANAVKLEEIGQKIKKLAASKGFPSLDLKSAKALGEFLFGENGLNITVTESEDFPGGKPPLNEKSGQFKTDADTIELMVSEFPEVPEVLKWLLEWRGYEKLSSTYLQNMYNNIDSNSEMRFQFKQTGAATGRFSAPGGEAEQGQSGIPIHGIPATSALRTCFEAREGYTMIKSDYAGEELRIATNVSGEPVWIKEFLEGDGDLHSITARAFFNKSEVTKDERKAGKIANFALLYGGGPASIIRATGCDKLEATRRKSAFDKAVPTFASWIKSQHKKVRKDGGVWTPFGRWIAIPDIHVQDKRIISACERKSINYPIQGAGADIMKISLVLLCKEFYKKGWLLQGGGDDSVRMLLTVHDEIVFEIRHARVQEALKVITKVMALPTNIPRPPHSPVWKVPLIVEPLIGTNWAGEYDYGMLTHGKAYKQDQKLKDIEEVIGDRVYHKVPPWLEGLFQRGSEEEHEAQEAPSPPALTPIQASEVAVAVTPSAPPPTPILAQEKPMPVPAPVPVPREASKVFKPAEVTPDTIQVKVNFLSKSSVRQVREACAHASDPDFGKLICVVDAMGHILVHPSLGIRVLPEAFITYLKDRNLSDGAIYPYMAS